MGFEIIESRKLREKVFYLKHSSGLDIYVAPKKGYSSQYAIFGTKYGSIDNLFDEGGTQTAVPEGIAHFLEHKLFESEDGDAFSRFAKTGASANAYTSFDRTCYLFSCTSEFRASLEILLDFVQKPYFTDKTVRKEQGIIGQEIRMYDDDPNWQVFFGLLRSLYKKHPVRTDIAGTVESIAQITPELLYKCYHSFYNLNNMVLCVAGDVDPALVEEAADRQLKPAPSLSVKSVFEPEPQGIVTARAEKKLAVSVPLFNLGFKDVPCEGFAGALQETTTEILLELLCGDASPLYRRLYDKGLINTSFSPQYFAGRSFAAAVVGGESRDPDQVAGEFMQETEALKSGGIEKADFERAKKAVFGQLAAHFDSVDDVANGIASCRFADIGPFDLIEAASQVTAEGCMERLGQLFTQDKWVLPVK